VCESGFSTANVLRSGAGAGGDVGFFSCSSWWGFGAKEKGDFSANLSMVVKLWGEESGAFGLIFFAITFF
jgi:hypothetical protein